MAAATVNLLVFTERSPETPSVPVTVELPVALTPPPATVSAPFVPTVKTGVPVDVRISNGFDPGPLAICRIV